jgi:hypothetical protein
MAPFGLTAAVVMVATLASESVYRTAVAPVTSSSCDASDAKLKYTVNKVCVSISGDANCPGSGNLTVRAQ